MEEQDDEDPSGMTFSEMAATLSGDKTAQLLFVAQNKLKKLQNSKRSDLNSKSSMQFNISISKSRLNDFIRRKEEQKEITGSVKANFPDGVESVTVKGKTISKSISTELSPIVEQYYDDYTFNRNTPPLKISLNNGKGEAIVHFNEGKMVYNLYVDGKKLVENRDFSGAKGLMASIDRQIESQENTLSSLEKKIEDEENKISGLEEAIKKPWGKEEELKVAQQEVENLQKQLEEKAKQNDVVRQIENESRLDVDGNIVDETVGYKKQNTELYRQDESSQDISKVNERFNEQLSGLTEENADKVVFSLGMPSDILLSSGVVDKPMKLYGNKVIKKMKEHGFTLDELRNLPEAVSNPIAVFNNYRNKNWNRSILTDLRTEQGNFLVTVDLGKDADVDFNIISSVFGKGDNSIINWINKGYATYINKEKAQEFLLHQSAPIAAASANSELSTTTKIVENFKNPTISEGKMVAAANELADSLNTEVEIVADPGQIQDEDSRRLRKKQQSKGWYDVNTGKVYVVIPNNTSIADVQATILHEVVVHKGLRGLLGDKFDGMMDTVFKNLPKDIKMQVFLSAVNEYKGDVRVATEEYLASIAENSSFSAYSAFSIITLIFSFIAFLRIILCRKAFFPCLLRNRRRQNHIF